MRNIIVLLALFALIMVIQAVSLTEAFGGQPGTQIQMQANKPIVYVARVPDYSAPKVVEDDEWRLF